MRLRSSPAPTVCHLTFLADLALQLPIGFQVEPSFGWWRLALIYLLSGIAGNILSAIFLPFIPEVGASSSLYGWISIYFVDLLANWKYYKAPGIKLATWTAGTIVSLLMGLLPCVRFTCCCPLLVAHISFSYVDNFAHIGGSLGGIFVTMIVVPHAFPAQNLRALRLSGVILTVIFFATSLAFFYSKADASLYCPWCALLNCSSIFEWCRATAYHPPN